MPAGRRARSVFWAELALIYKTFNAFVLAVQRLNTRGRDNGWVDSFHALANDNTRDVMDCGPGFDVAYVIQHDPVTLRGCEQVIGSVLSKLLHWRLRTTTTARAGSDPT